MSSSHSRRATAVRRRGARIVGLATSLLAAAGCRDASAGSRAPEAPVAIGIGADVSKPAMQSVLHGVELAVARLNHDRPPGRARFVIRTPRGGVPSSIAIAAGLRDDPSVVGVVGHTDSGSSLETAGIYEDAEEDGARAVVAVSPTSTSTALSGRSPWLFRVCPSDMASSRAVARFAADSLGAHRAAVVYRADAYGKGWARAFTDAFVRAGGSIVQRDPHLPGMTEWDAYAAYAARLKPDVILFPGSAADAEPYLRALRAAGVRAPLIGGDAVAALDHRAGGASGDFDGVSYTAFFVARQARSVEAVAFAREFEARYGMAPDQSAALAYDAAMLIGRAALEAGADRHAVRDWIEGVGSVRPPVDGVTGRIAFDRLHDVVDKPVVIAAVAR